jgi:hypothetical protein
MITPERKEYIRNKFKELKKRTITCEFPAFTVDAVFTWKDIYCNFHGTLIKWKTVRYSSDAVKDVFNVLGKDSLEDYFYSRVEYPNHPGVAQYNKDIEEFCGELNEEETMFLFRL